MMLSMEVIRMKNEELNTHLLIYIMSDFVHFIKEQFYGDAQLDEDTAKLEELEKINTYVEQYVKDITGTHGIALLRQEIASIL